MSDKASESAIALGAALSHRGKISLNPTTVGSLNNPELTDDDLLHW